jgi:hypothetical protein
MLWLNNFQENFRLSLRTVILLLLGLGAGPFHSENMTRARWFQQPMSARNRAPCFTWRFRRVSFVFSSEGSSCLSIDTGRRRRPFPIPRAQHLCLKCASQLVCDDFHVIFECTALAPIRDQFSALFTLATQSMLGFM